MKKEKKNSGKPEKISHGELTLLNRNHKEYPDSPEKAKLEAFENRYPERDYVIEFDCPEFTSLCPVTGQPDFGHIRVRYIAEPDPCRSGEAARAPLDARGGRLPAERRNCNFRRG